MKDKDFDSFLEMAFQPPADLYGLMCAYCGLLFSRPPDPPKTHIRRRICTCPGGQKTKEGLIKFAERKDFA